MLNQGALSLMVSIGHRTGLFDGMSELPPADAGKIAIHVGLSERYVREWLGAMVAGGVVRFDPANDHYHLPKNHAALLCRRSEPDNIAVFAALDEHILPLIDGMEGRLSEGIRVLDLGCGRGRALLHLAERFPGSEFVGYELSHSAVESARHEASARGLANIRFEQRDLTHFDHEADPDDFDLVTAFDAIHDQAAPQRVLDGIHRTLKPGGSFLMQDIRASSRLENNLEHPIAPLLYTLSTMHCMTVSLARDGAGLGTMWGEELAVEMLGKAGFERVEVRQLEHDFQNNFYVMCKG